MDTEARTETMPMPQTESLPIMFRFQQAMGVENHAVVAQHFDMLLKSIGTADAAKCAQAVEAVAAIFAELQPADELERVLLLQVEMANMRAAEALRQSRAAESVEAQNAYVNMTTRLMRICAQQIDAFVRYRNRNSNASVTVNQIKADNAIVGTVYTEGVKRHADD